MNNVYQLREGQNQFDTPHVGDGGNPGGIGSGGGGGDMIEARIAALEVSVKHIDTQISDIKTDIRELRSGQSWLLYGGTAALAFILMVFGWGYSRLADRSDSLSEKITQVQITLQKVADSVVQKHH